jgi:hypothetical protein
MQYSLFFSVTSYIPSLQTIKSNNLFFLLIITITARFFTYVDSSGDPKKFVNFIDLIIDLARVREVMSL